MFINLRCRLQAKYIICLVRFRFLVLRPREKYNFYQLIYLLISEYGIVLVRDTEHTTWDTLVHNLHLHDNKHTLGFLTKKEYSATMQTILMLLKFRKLGLKTF